MATKTKTAAGKKGGKKGDQNGSKRDTLALMGKMLAHLEAAAGQGGTRSNVNPAQVFATLKDDRIERQAGFKTPREYLMAVIEAGRGRLDKRLEPLRSKAAGGDENQGQSDPFGGFLVPFGFVPDVLKVEPEMDPIGAATTKIPMATTIVKIPARTDKDHTSSVSGGVTVSRKAETDPATASRMQMEQVTLEAHSLFGLSYASEELLTDSAVSFAALLQQGFQDQFTYALINERLNGTGIGEYMGIINSPCTISVAKESGQAAATITYRNVIDMRSRCYGYGKAFWLANHDCTPSLMLLNQQVGTGGAVVWQPSAREDHPDTLLGRPLYFTEYTKAVGTQGDIVLANWSEYLEGQYQPMQQEESIHVRFVNHERTFKFWVRNAGQPWWRVPLTPKWSTKTLSPFVVLDARS